MTTKDKKRKYPSIRERDLAIQTEMAELISSDADYWDWGSDFDSTIIDGPSEPILITALNQFPNDQKIYLRFLSHKSMGIPWSDFILSRRDKRNPKTTHHVEIEILGLVKLANTNSQIPRTSIPDHCWTFLAKIMSGPRKDELITGYYNSTRRIGAFDLNPDLIDDDETDA